MSVFNRREFISMGTLAACAGCVTLPGKRKVDPSLSVFLSDIHVSGKNVKGQPTYQNPLFLKAVNQILAMDPLPARVFIFGDIALWHGISADYEESAPMIRKLEDAGIEVFLTTGNHDHREPLFGFFEKQRRITPVAGRFVSVVDVGGADFVLFDSLDENPKGEGSHNNVAGKIDKAQAEWLCDFAASAKRPFFMGAHHSQKELEYNGERLLKNIVGRKNFKGYVHGHLHVWSSSWYHFGYAKQKILRSLCLPSTGWWGDIGFATFRTLEDRAEVSLVMNDFFFPAPDKQRPADWDQIKREKMNSVCTFLY